MDIVSVILGVICGGSIATVIVVLLMNKRQQDLKSEHAEFKAQRGQFDERIEEKEKLLNTTAETLKSTSAANEVLRAEQTKLLTRIASLETEQRQLTELKAELAALRDLVESMRSSLAQKDRQTTEFEVALKKERQLHAEKLQLLEAAKANLTTQFENLANRILDEKSKKFAVQNKEGIEQILTPLKQNIENFKKKVEETYEKGTRDRVQLRTQIEELTKSNRQISDEAMKLAQALKGQSQTQGAWGEMILEMVLEKSGLMAGREYTVQQSITTDEGRRYRPDVVVHLPNQRDIVVDSKVSLTAFERFFNSKETAVKSQALKEHVQSIQQHVKGLSAKSYQELEAVRTLDYVLLFIPIEGAYSVAVQHEPGLIGDALEKNVIIVTPSTLLLALRTVENIWRYERQNSNAVEIARRAGKLYEKFVGFVADLEKVSDHLRRAQKVSDDAINKLHTGRGNLVRSVEQLKKMGAKTQKQLEESMVEQAMLEDPEGLVDDISSPLALNEQAREDLVD